MAIKMRLQRFGVHKRPFYRVVASDSRVTRDGKFLDIVGTYDTILNIIKLDNEKVQKWLSCGAQPTQTVKKILKKNFVFQKDNQIKKPQTAK
ncbi:30S ribosomal protein S16 [Candidatus Phytoplasma australiense]|uniref:Small ribosomal subunit protein bS16 n=2 Tax=Phytoplasma australiense TaxID=59748 RepID=RS16_PHYAS|nr:30S ribosomal protein S16 [Candidatus Phytoplasma australiense]B1VAB0.1 RecName: Full=Small ribosomal subunit protein bS16; AltName: Full=30S ribosomal protein S16 [Candidatus Phytoplasma australiense]AGL90267.1 30S ribosomal protein S16 [Strawberry lethal yellows phytoplasma (CPA) str. NZSb11]CAM11883.1 30S ribosomal protein S16 [Candidatus Phytoplasma australiense]